MNDFFGRDGPGPCRPGPPPAFRDSLDELRDAVREGLADAAGHAVSRAVRRAAARLLGGSDANGPIDAPHRGHAEGAWDRGKEDDSGEGWDDPWRDDRPAHWGGHDEDDGRVDADEALCKGHGRRRLIAAACCQAAASVVRAASPGKPLPSLACAALSALALLLGGGAFACESGLALAEALLTLAEALAAATAPTNR